MSSRSALRRFSMTPLLLAAALFCASSLTLSAQTPSRALAALQPVAQADRIAVHPDFAPLTQLSQQLPGWVQGASQSSAHSIDLSTNLRITLILRRDDAAQAAFTQLLADQQDRSSPLYHQWLTPQQIGKLYGPTPNDLATLTSWLTSQGLKIENISPSGVMIAVSGTAALVGNAFHTSFASFDLSGAVGDNEPTRTRLSAVSEPTIPTALSPLIRSIHGLAEVPLHPMSHATALRGSLSPNASTPRPQLTLTDGEHFLTPNDFALIYDISSVYTGGNTGAKIGSTNQHIAVIGESRVAATDISEFETTTGLPNVVPNVIIPTGATDPGTPQTGVQDEATLDVDRVIGTAPGAAVDLVIAASTMTSGGIFIAAQYNVDTLNDPVMTISFGGCEADAGVSGVDLVDTFASTGAAAGITTLVSSGDSGAAGCDTAFVAVKAGVTQVASINFICSSTYVTCVGGTQFNDTASPATYWSSSNGAGYESALKYIPEGAWNEPSSVNSSNVTIYAPASTGGGVSTYIAKPTWQTGTGVPSGSFRFVPDVSFSAAEHDGYYACLAYAGGDCSTNHFEDFSGTSAAAPGMAGVVALINTKTGTASGNINPSLYSTAKSTPDAFHDATIATSGVTGCTTSTPSICNNSTPGPTGLSGGLKGFDLTTGFDEATGLGSIDVANLITAVSAPSLISTTLAITPPAAITAGQSATFTATLTPASAGTPTGTVQFYSNGTAIGSAATLSSDKATSPSQTFATAGTYTITAKYSGDASFAASTAPSVSLVVNAVTTISTTLAITPPAAITAGQSAAFTATLTPASAGTPSGTVQFYSNGTAIGSGVTLGNNTATSASQAFPTAGTYTITAKYSGDTSFAVSTAPGVSLVVNPATSAGSFTLAASPATLTLAAGATSSNTSTITGTSVNSYAGTVALTCKVVFNSGTANDLPTCSLSPASIALTSDATATSTLKIASTAATTDGCSTQVTPMTSPWQRGSVIVLAGLLLVVLPLRKRRGIRGLALACLLTAGIVSTPGCGRTTTGTGCTPVTVPGTTAGSYTVTITGTQGSAVATTTVALTIN
jgi:hypothetical protein